MKKLFLTSGLVLMMALPAVAQNRDSDGDVISVIDYTSVPIFDGKPVYYTLGTDPKTLYQFDTSTVVDAGVVLPEQVSISGTTYQVERTGNDIFLLPDGGSQRIRANLVQVSGKRVNPTSFALD
ncbi:MAG: hypothetical protein ACI8R4_003511 [Paracoccaceae bacterium]|jgi:hypothetical protein